MDSANLSYTDETLGSAADIQDHSEGEPLRSPLRSRAGREAASQTFNIRPLAPPRLGLAPSGLEAQVALADGLMEQIAFLDRNWKCLAVNRAWTNALDKAHSGLAPGSNYLDICMERARKGDKEALAMIEALAGIDSGEISEFEQLDAAEGVRKGRIYRLRVYTCGVPGRQWRVLARYDVTELTNLKRQKLRFGNQLLNAEAEERRRVARDLHDSTAQDLVALQLSLANLKRGRRSHYLAKFADADEALERLQREIRSISYLFHLSPDQPSLSKALESMAKGFGRRTGLNLTLWLDEVEVDDPKLCMAVHRLTQEALANVHRHAKASEVEVRLIATESRLHVMVKDNGIGLDPDFDAVAGVGLRSMRERIEEFGGSMVLKSGKNGTSVIASIPLAQARLA
jgi:signal transduction histidine kinase